MKRTALDATTSAAKWHVQTVHHDFWDYHVPMQPTLIDFPTEDGKRVPALIVDTRIGQLFEATTWLLTHCPTTSKRRIRLDCARRGTARVAAPHRIRRGAPPAEAACHRYP
ncbi:hypothetical protein [Burkholderia sp. A9]|uniref:hypothetical protein n=1 Tax=Burkholderia sp. A9 TaxID=1365108 RepID=UPI001F1DC1FA|nr:hypothetical protein [Burkholderia sp. A9]